MLPGLSPLSRGGRGLAAAALACGIALVGCGSTPAPDVGVTEQDYSLTLGQSSVINGRVDLAVTNSGPTAHEVLVFRTDLDQAALPLGADGRVEEDHGEGIKKIVDSGSDLAAGKRRVLHATLPAGRYVVICNIANHYELGMHASLTVT